MSRETGFHPIVRDRVSNDKMGGDKGLNGQLSSTLDLGKVRILSLDDNPEILRLMHQMLSDAGYESWITDDEAAAMAYLHFSDRIDLFTQDLERPEGIGGCQFLRLIKSHPKLRAIPVLLVSGHDLYASRQVLIQSGVESMAQGYLAKPFGPAQLVASVQRLILMA